MTAHSGTVCRAAQNASEAHGVLAEAGRMASEGDHLLAAAAVMQAVRFRTDLRDLDAALKMHAELLRKQADDAFYGHGHLDAMLYFQLAVGLDRENPLLLWEAIAPCLQGSPVRPREALPLAVLVASLNPARNEIAYVERLIHEEAVREQTDGTVLWQEQFWEGQFRMGITGLAASDGVLLAGADRVYAFRSKQLQEI